MEASRAGTFPAQWSVPRHVAVVMNGNRRWAREHALSSNEGYQAGMRALLEITRAAAETGVEILTADILATENPRDDQEERGLFLKAFSLFARGASDYFVKENVRVGMIGRLDRLPNDARAALNDLLKATETCNGLLLMLAIDYDARSELCDAARALMRHVAEGRVKAADVTETTLAAYLSTADLPDPDLFIHTGGELRLSNFLLYQAAYSELWSTPCCWPDFSASLLHEAIADFSKRQRRFGT